LTPNSSLSNSLNLLEECGDLCMLVLAGTILFSILDRSWKVCISYPEKATPIQPAILLSLEATHLETISELRFSLLTIPNLFYQTGIAGSLEKRIIDS